MSVEQIWADYEQLAEIVLRFEAERDAIEQLINNLHQRVSDLQDGGWVGEGANTFYTEMEDEIFTALKRLEDALQMASRQTAFIRMIMMTAEEQASDLFSQNALAMLLGIGGLGMGLGGLGLGGLMGGALLAGGLGRLNPISTNFIGPNPSMNPLRGRIWQQGYQGDDDFWDVGATLYENEWVAGAARYEGEVSGRFGEAIWAAMGWRGEGSVEFGFGDDGPQFQAYGDLGVYLVRGEFSSELAGFDIMGEAQVGANIQGNLDIDFDISDGEVEIEGEIGGFAGVSAEGQISRDFGPVEAGVNGRIGYGIGLGGNFEAEFDNGRITIDAGAYAFAGLGGGLEGSIELDIPDLVDDVVNMGKEGIDILDDIIPIW
jgi:WXG100 family type VII secretion target